MKIDFPYPGYERIAPVEVPDANLMGVYAPRSMGQTGEEEVLASGFAEPYGAPHLREAVKPTDRVLILVDDSTRGTPVPRLLKRVIGNLWAARDAGAQPVGGIPAHVGDCDGRGGEPDAPQDGGSCTHRRPQLHRQSRLGL